MHHFILKNFGPIKDVDIKFGDLTILVGPQASGKSLTLEALKLVIDRDHIINMLDRYNYILGHDPKKILNNYFGEGMSSIWTGKTKMEYDGKSFSLTAVPKKAASNPDETMFYIPAQRIMSISDGRPKNFMEFDNSSPYVLRMFSETLRLFMQNGLGHSNILFPIAPRLKHGMKRSFNESIFHNAKIIMEERYGQKKMVLNVDNMSVPFMSWSAGQKEFMPLLLAFYCLSGPPSKVVKKEKYKYVVIEEPEMGLHPKAIVSIILQILELMQNGYKVILTTHTPVILEFAWAFNYISKNREQFTKAICDLFGVEETSSVGHLLSGVSNKVIRTYFFELGKGMHKAISKDISNLDVSAEDSEIADWGGLSSFSSVASEIVSKYGLYE